MLGTASRFISNTGRKLYGDGMWRNLYLARIETVDGAPYREQNLGLFGLVYQTFTLLVKLGLLR
jgi:hypothetical protein